MNEFIYKFKQTSYYKNLFNIEEDILLIYIGGSRCFNTSHEFSDYDITIITSGGSFKDAIDECYVTYKGQKIHWYYCPIQWLFKTDHTDMYHYIGALTLRCIDSSTILYKNNNYNNVINHLYKLSKKLLPIVCYCLFEFKRASVMEVIQEDIAINEYSAKTLYYMCLASYFVMDEPLDTTLLRKLSLSKHNIHVDTETKEKAIKRLQLYRDYITNNPVDIDKQAAELYSVLQNELNGENKYVSY